MANLNNLVFFTPPFPSDTKRSFIKFAAVAEVSADHDGISRLCVRAGKGPIRTIPHYLTMAGHQRFLPACAAALGELCKTIREFFSSTNRAVISV